MSMTVTESGPVALSEPYSAFVVPMMDSGSVFGGYYGFVRGGIWQITAELDRINRELGVDAEVVAFIDDMPERYTKADLVVCRAGAITVSELAAGGVASVLIPFVASTTSHQRENAEFMASRGAAIHLPQAELSATKLADLLHSLTRDRLLAMAQAARSVGKPDATATVVSVIEKVAA